MKGVARFFLLAFGFSWLMWVPLALSRKSARSAPWAIPYALGGFGPSIAAAFLVQREAPPAARRSFWRRVADPRGIGPWQWATVLLLFPVSKVLTWLVVRRLGGIPAPLDYAVKVLSSPASMVSFATMALVGGPLSEELGWRGYAQDPMQARFGRVRGSLLLGGVWTAWHLPLFFIPGIAQSAMGLGTPAFWRFAARNLFGSVLMGWAYSSSGGSTLAAILLHATGNASATLMVGFGKAPDPTADLVDTALSGLAAAVVASAWGRSAG